MVQCVKLMLSKFLHLQFSLFECYVCHQNVSCLKRFTWYGHYACEMEDIIIPRFAAVSYFAMPEIIASLFFL